MTQPARPTVPERERAFTGFLLWNHPEIALAAGILAGILAALTLGFIPFGNGTELGSAGGCRPQKSLTLVEVVGNSMLPTLNGGTVYETCPKCGMHGPRVSQGASVCPNCGWIVSERERDSLAYQNQSQQEIRFEDLLATRPRRAYAIDDVVVVRPNSAQGLVIKRVAGVPGDHLEVRDGMLFRNGRRSVRPLEVWNQMRIPVYLDDFRPDGVSRWLASGSGAQPLADGWRFGTNHAVCLKYAHQTGRLLPDRSGNVVCRMEPAPITNLRAENGTQYRADSVALISELLCEFTLDRGCAQKTESARLLLSLPTNDGEFLFALVPEKSDLASVKEEILREVASGTLESMAGGTFEAGIYAIPRASSKSEPSESPSCRVTASTLDGLPRLLWNGKPLASAQTFSLTEAASEAASEAAAEPVKLHENQESPGRFDYVSTVRIWSRGDESVEIRHLALFRGEYWENFLRNFHYFAQNTKKTLAFDCNCGYYLVGDNFFVSDDSRQWGTVSGEQILGKVILPRRRFENEAPKVGQNH